jgi:hypothetical protein
LRSHHYSPDGFPDEMNKVLATLTPASLCKQTVGFKVELLEMLISALYKLEVIPLHLSQSLSQIESYHTQIAEVHKDIRSI